MSSATVAMCGRPWRFYCERKRDREEEEKQGKERLQVGPGRVSSVDSPRESGRRLREALELGRAAAALGSFPLSNFCKQKCEKRPRSLARN